MDKVHFTGPHNAKIAFVGMGPASDEMNTGRPFTGPSGQVLLKALNRLGMSRSDVWLGNVSETFLPPGTSLFAKKDLNADKARLKDELESLPELNVIVPLGDEPLRIICDKQSITKWRGSILPSTLVQGRKCVPTVHPAWIVRGMHKWESVFTFVDIARALEESKFREIKLPTRNCITGPSLQTVLDYIFQCKQRLDVSLDIEVYGYSESGMGEIGCIGIGYTPSEALCIPFTRDRGAYWRESDEVIIWDALSNMLQSDNRRIIGQNLAFEWIYFWKHGIFPREMYIDTMLLHHTLYPDFGGTGDVYGGKQAFDEPGHSLAFINSQYTKTPYYKDDGRRRAKGGSDHSWWAYNCYDVMVTMDAAYQMHDEAVDKGVWHLYEQFKRRPFIHAVRMEWFGIAVDHEKREQLYNETSLKIKALQTEINEKLGRVLNVNSPKQMQELLYNRMKLPVKKNKYGRPTADKHVLESFAMRTQDPVLSLISELRSLIDFKGDVLEQRLGPDKRIHSHYKLGGTDTNRWSSTRSIMGTGTNLQNIPARGPARELFIPEL